MSKWSSLPREILDNVFQKLCQEKDYFDAFERDYLTQCSLTCRGWKVSVQCLLCSKINLRSLNALESKSHFLASNDHTIGKYVKYLCVKFDIGNNEVLDMIDSSFPRLEVLKYDDHINLCYPYFCKMITENEKFRNLRQLPLPEYKEECEQYEQCMIFMKDRINQITLNGGDSLSGKNKIIYYNLIGKIDLFSNLSTVTIHANTSDMSTTHNSIMSYIETITKNNRGSIQELFLHICDYGPTFRPFHTTELNLVQPAVSIKTLHIETDRGDDVGFYIPEDSFLLYLMKKFPNLSAITLLHSQGGSHFHDITLNDITITQSTAVVLQFLTYISKTQIHSTLCHFFLCSEEQTSRIIRGFYRALLDKNNNNSLFPSQLEINYDTSQKRESDEDLSKLLFINLEDFLLDKSATQQIIYLTLRGGYGRHSFFQLQLQLIKQVGWCFKKISLLVITFSSELASALNYISQYCTQLVDLCIDGDSHDVISYDQVMVPFLYERTLFKNYSVEKITLTRCTPITETLNYILSHFPNLKTLVMKDFLLFGEQYDPICIKSSTNSILSLYLPTSSLEHLHIHVGCLNFQLLNKFKSVYIKVVTESEENARYCFVDVIRKAGYIIPMVLDDPTEEVYQDRILDEKVLKWHIYFKSVKKLTITTH